MRGLSIVRGAGSVLWRPKIAKAGIEEFERPVRRIVSPVV